MLVDDTVLDVGAEMVMETIAKAVPEECLCVAVINEILERAKVRTNTMVIASFQQCLEGQDKGCGKAVPVEDTRRIHYLCNGEQEGCERRTCYKTNESSEPVCRHTPDVRYALNFSRLPYEKSAYWEGIAQGKNEDADTKKQ